MLIALALVSLFVAPLLTASRLQRIRQFSSDVVSPALVSVNDLEAALATGFAARSELAEESGQSAAASTSASAAELSINRDEARLDELVRLISPDAVSRFAEARASIAAWRREEERFSLVARDAHSDSRDVNAADTRGRRWEAVQVALGNMQLLEDELNSLTISQRLEITRLEKVSFIVPASLVPLALLALLAVAWTARRTLLLSHAAAIGQGNAERAMAAKGALMRGVTHDLKNPLGAARGYADLLADGTLGPVPETQAKVITRLRNLLTATLDTVNDLVELSGAEADELRIARMPTDLAALARECVADYRAIGDAAGVTVQFAAAESLDGGASLPTDPQRVRQVLGNLLSNAVKYTPRGGVVHVSVGSAADPELGRVIALEVADTGPGIPDQLHERVFEEFFRVPATVAIAPGTGVGLAIARRVARLLGGDLRVRDTPGGGSTFSLLVPMRTSVP